MLIHLIFGFSQMVWHQEHIRSRGEMWEKASFLDHVSNPTSELHHPVRIDGLAAEENRTGVGFNQADDETQQGRFTATAWSDENGGFSSLNFQIRRLERVR